MPRTPPARDIECRRGVRGGQGRGGLIGRFLGRARASPGGDDPRRPARGAPCVGRGRCDGPRVHWGACCAGIGQLRRLLRPRRIAWDCLASHGLRYTTFSGGDGCHTGGFFNPWLAQPIHVCVWRGGRVPSAGLSRRAGRSRGRHGHALGGAVGRPAPGPRSRTRSRCLNPCSPGFYRWGMPSPLFLTYA